MPSKRRFNAIVLALLTGLLIAACAAAEQSDPDGLVLAATVAGPSGSTAPTVVPVPTASPAPLPTSAAQPAATGPAKFPTPEPWQPDTPAPGTPASDAPAPDTPAPDTPTSDASAPDTPAPGTPAPDTPTSDAPAPDTPTSDAPASDAAVSGTPASDTAAEPTGSGTVEDIERAAVAPYELGACFSELSSSDVATAVSCDQPHQVEVYHVGAFADPAGTPHPGDAMLTRGLEQCAPSFEALPGVAQSGESFEAQVYGPSARQWDNGARFLACLLIFPEDVDQPLADIDRSVAPATVGECFSGTDVDGLSPVSCQEPHRFQVYASTGVLEIEAAQDFCRRALGDEALFVDFDRVWHADVIVGVDQVDCYLSSEDPTTGSVFDDPES